MGTKTVMTIVLLMVIVTFVIIIFFKGYENGKEKAVKTAYENVKREYAQKIKELKSDMDTIIKANENRIAAINRNHNNTIEQMTNSYNSTINRVNKEYQETVSSMERSHMVNIENTRNESFSSGQRNMARRINEVYNMDVQNKPLPDDWNATVYIIKD